MCSRREAETLIEQGLVTVDGVVLESPAVKVTPDQDIRIDGTRLWDSLMELARIGGTAKGGVLVALADRFGLPIHAVGVGEQIDDLSPFDPDEFAAALVGTDG